MADKKALTATGGKYPVTVMVQIMGSLYEYNGNIWPYVRSKGIANPPPAR